MKKFMITALALVCSSAAIAATDHAVLNVEGEIQINGKTVIDKDGNWTGKLTSNVINIEEYADAISVTRVVLKKKNDDSNEYHLVYNPSTGVATKEESLINNDVFWSMEWFDRTNVSNKVKTTTKNWNEDTQSHQTCTNTVANTFAATTSYAPVALGSLSARGDVYTSETLSNDCDADTIGTTTQNYLSMAMIVTAQASYTFGQETLEDCIYVSQINSWRDTVQPRVYCKGVGLVAFDDFELKTIIK
ncbi:hypothetical protein LRP50_23195 [Enterovibrio sp. ZSDZ42]|uniref:Uncharacterized protein n=1 Tax=Enterovibrio gelatinilyticus TaxID=2899819 RepID=A0ABT5R870_9GAMM|nr:hypothetical protein [Enterovibrio sp. ZSDZ42]MDD1796030.1 hypothetical protein [Enterovibrio sp. ZSDZ42]